MDSISRTVNAASKCFLHDIKWADAIALSDAEVTSSMDVHEIAHDWGFKALAMKDETSVSRSDTFSTNNLSRKVKVGKEWRWKKQFQNGNKILDPPFAKLWSNTKIASSSCTDSLNSTATMCRSNNILAVVLWSKEANAGISWCNVPESVTFLSAQTTALIQWGTRAITYFCNVY